MELKTAWCLDLLDLKKRAILSESHMERCSTRKSRKIQPRILYSPTPTTKDLSLGALVVQDDRNQWKVFLRQSDMGRCRSENDESNRSQA
jgi:hypothetical protein